MRKFAGGMPTIANPDQTAPCGQSDLDLHCLADISFKSFSSLRYSVFCSFAGVQQKRKSTHTQEKESNYFVDGPTENNHEHSWR